MITAFLNQLPINFIFWTNIRFHSCGRYKYLKEQHFWASYAAILKTKCVNKWDIPRIAAQNYHPWSRSQKPDPWDKDESPAAQRAAWENKKEKESDFCLIKSYAIIKILLNKVNAWSDRLKSCI